MTNSNVICEHLSPKLCSYWRDPEMLARISVQRITPRQMRAIQKGINNPLGANSILRENKKTLPVNIVRSSTNVERNRQKKERGFN